MAGPAVTSREGRICSRVTGSGTDCQNQKQIARHPQIAERTKLDATRFEIVVKGRLSPTLAAAIEGFEVSCCDRGLTHLVGWVPDQARLHGTLELLRDLNIELVSVNPVPSEATGASGRPGSPRERESRA